MANVTSTKKGATAPRLSDFFAAVAEKKYKQQPVKAAVVEVALNILLAGRDVLATISETASGMAVELTTPYTGGYRHHIFIASHELGGLKSLAGAVAKAMVLAEEAIAWTLWSETEFPHLEDEELYATACALTGMSCSPAAVKDLLVRANKEIDLVDLLKGAQNYGEKRERLTKELSFARRDANWRPEEIEKLLGTRLQEAWETGLLEKTEVFCDFCIEELA